MSLFHFRSREVRPWRVIVLFVSLCTLLLSGLWFYGKQHQPRSWQLRSGITWDEVIEVMGRPDMVLGDVQSQEWWYEERRHVRLYFRGDLLSSASLKGHPVND